MPQTLFINANLVLDGFADLQRGFNLLVSDGRIAAVSAATMQSHETASVTPAARAGPVSAVMVGLPMRYCRSCISK